MTAFGFVTPTLKEDRFVTVIGPDELAGSVVVGDVDAEPCYEPSAGGACGLVRNHRGAHWLCSLELIETSGPFVLLRGGSAPVKGPGRSWADLTDGQPETPRKETQGTLTVIWPRQGIG